MGNTRVELNFEGVRQLMTSPQMVALCERKARAVAAAAGDGYTITTHIGPNRCNASVITDSYEAKKANLDGNALIKALGAAR